jgi:hypothetical protein
VGLDGRRHADRVVEVDLGIRSDASLLESRAGDDPRSVTDRTDRRARRLFDLDDVALDVDRLADAVTEIGNADVLSGENLDALDRVRFDHRLGESEVAVLSYLDEFDDEFVADVVLASEVRFVDETGDVFREVDEDAVLDDPVDGRYVVGSLLDVLEGTLGS